MSLKATGLSYISAIQWQYQYVTITEEAKASTPAAYRFTLHVSPGCG